MSGRPESRTSGLPNLRASKLIPIMPRAAISAEPISPSRRSPPAIALATAEASATADLPPSVFGPPSSALRPSPLTPFEHGVIDIFVRLADMMGLPKSVGEIYGLLYASAQPLAFQDIIDRLDISKGSASQGLRLLRTNGAIKVVYAPTDRRDHYVPETELRALISGFLREKIQPHLESGTARLETLKGLARTQTAPDAASARILRGRIDKLAAWHKRGKAVVPLVTKFFG